MQLKDLPMDASAAVNPKDVIEWVVRDTNVNFKEIQGRSRKRHIVAARNLVMYGLRYFCKYSLKDIAEVIQCDHTTVIHHLDKELNGMWVHDDAIQPRLLKMKDWYSKIVRLQEKQVKEETPEKLIQKALSGLNMPLVVKGLEMFQQYLHVDYKKGGLDSEGVKMYHSINALIG